MKASTRKTHFTGRSSRRTRTARFIGAALLSGAVLIATDQNDDAVLAKLKGIGFEPDAKTQDG